MNRVQLISKYYCNCIFEQWNDVVQRYVPALRYAMWLDR